MVGQKIIYCCGTFMVSPSSRQLDYLSWKSTSSWLEGEGKKAKRKRVEEWDFLHALTHVSFTMSSLFKQNIYS